MTIKFCMVSVHWPASQPPLSCFYDEETMTCDSEEESNYKGYQIDLKTLQGKELEFTEEQLRRVQNTLEIDPNTEPFIWKSRALFALARDEGLFSIDFIPQDPTKDNIMHIHRIKEGDREKAVERTYLYEYGGCKFFLPDEKYPIAAHIFDLFNPDLSSTLTRLSLDRTLVSKALTYLQNDPDTLGIALTVAEGTFIWFKSAGKKNLKDTNFQ